MTLGAASKRLALVFAVALAARAALLVAMSGQLRAAWAPDTEEYAACARGMYQQGRFTRSDRAPFAAETFRTPGYPAFLFLTCAGESCPRVAVALWLQALLGASAAGLAFVAALLLFEDARAALFAGLALALDPVTVLHAGVLLSETLFTFFCAATLLALAWAWRGGPRSLGRCAAAGVLAGVAALVRPAGLYFCLFGAGALVLAWRRREGRALGAAALLAGSLAVTGAWAARNWRDAGRFTFSTIQGLNFAYMRAAGVEMELSGDSYALAYPRLRARVQADHGGPFADEKDESAFAQRWALRWLARHPVAAATVMVKDAVKMLGGHGLEMLSWLALHDPSDDPMSPRPPSGNLSGTRDLLRRHPGLWAPLALYLLAMMAVYLLAALGSIDASQTGELGALAVTLAPIAYFMAVSCGALAYYRFRLPLLPALFVLSGRGWSALRR